MDGFIVCIKTADNYKDIAEQIKTIWYFKLGIT